MFWRENSTCSEKADDLERTKKGLGNVKAFFLISLLYCAVSWHWQGDFLTDEGVLVI